MSNVRIKLNSKGVRELLRSEEMKEICREHAEAIRGRCGNGYECDAYTGKKRVNARVWASSARARQDNSRNNTILKALK